jgi:hypothetical protein
MRARISQSDAFARHIREAIDDRVARAGFPPAALVVSSDETLSAMVSKRLRDRGCDVLELRDAESFHEVLRDGAVCDMMFVDASMKCSPFHGLGYARRQGLDVPAIAIVRVEDDLARKEAERLDLLLCNRAVVLGSLDRLLLTALRRMPRVSRAA